eukprot:scaffold3933_cov64-Phaeocystis_antarctica.AAC.1
MGPDQNMGPGGLATPEKRASASQSACGRPPNKPTAASVPGGRCGCAGGVVVWSSDGAPLAHPAIPVTRVRGVCSLAGCVPLIHSLTSGKKREKEKQLDRASLEHEMLHDALELPVAVAPLGVGRLEAALGLLEGVGCEEQDGRVPG